MSRSAAARSPSRACVRYISITLLLSRLTENSVPRCTSRPVGTHDPQPRPRPSERARAAIMAAMRQHRPPPRSYRHATKPRHRRRPHVRCCVCLMVCPARRRVRGAAATQLAQHLLRLGGDDLGAPPPAEETDSTPRWPARTICWRAVRRGRRAERGAGPTPGFTSALGGGTEAPQTRTRSSIASTARTNASPRLRRAAFDQVGQRAVREREAVKPLPRRCAARAACIAPTAPSAIATRSAAGSRSDVAFIRTCDACSWRLGGTASHRRPAARAGHSA